MMWKNTLVIVKKSEPQAAASSPNTCMPEKAMDYIGCVLIFAQSFRI